MAEVTRASAESKLTCRVMDLDEAAPLWRKFSETDPFGVAQMLPWVSAWRKCVNPHVFAAALFDGQAPVLLLPLEIVREKGARIARYVGGTHANANFPLLKAEHAERVTPDAVDRLCQAIRDHDPSLDALSLTRQLTQCCGISNPILCLPSGESPNLALAFLLGANFESLAKERGWSRKQKKMRNQGRRLEERGGWSQLTSHDEAAAVMLMDCFFDLKVARFEQMGQKNAFKDAEVKDFFRQLFKEAAVTENPLFRLDALKVGDDIMAVSGSAFRHNSIFVEFGAVNANEPALSPGDFLYHQMIKQACADRYAVFDFGVGDEPYKRSWCDIEIQHVDSTLGFTARGKVHSAAFHVSNKAKLAIKRNAVIFGLIKKWRARKASKAADPASE